MKRFRTAAVALATLALAAGGAPQASYALWNPSQPPGRNLPDERPLCDPWVDQMRAAAIRFWAARGVTVPEFAIDQADDLIRTEGDDQHGGLGRAPYPDDPNGRIILNSRSVRIPLNRARSQRRPVKEKRFNFSLLATFVFHEAGHVGGLAHTAHGLMQASARCYEQIPWDARVLAKALIPDAPKRSRRT
jgi:hypothetical protein